jgi:hypothetical protein
MLARFDQLIGQLPVGPLFIYMQTEEARPPQAGLQQGGTPSDHPRPPRQKSPFWYEGPPLGLRAEHLAVCEGLGLPLEHKPELDVHALVRAC